MKKADDLLKKIEVLLNDILKAPTKCDFDNGMNNVCITVLSMIKQFEAEQNNKGE